MKKVLLSTSIAVLLVVALAVTAFAVDVSGPSTVATGDTIDITITGSGQGTSGIVSASGLEITNVSGTFSSASDFIVLADTPGGLSATYTCRVTAGAGETASLSVSDVVVSDGRSDSAGTSGSWSATVAGSEPTQEPTTTPTEEPTTEPTDTPSTTPTDTPSGEPTESVEPSASPSGDATATASATVKPGGSTTTKPGTKPSSGTTTTTKTDKMPKTGDATMDLWTLAVIAGACATVAVVAGKKVFSAK